MTSKTSFAITLATLTLIFFTGILAIITVYLLKNKLPPEERNFKHKTIIMKKFIKNNKKKLENIKQPMKK